MVNPTSAGLSEGAPPYSNLEVSPYNALEATQPYSDKFSIPQPPAVYFNQDDVPQHHIVKSPWHWRRKRILYPLLLSLVLIVAIAIIVPVILTTRNKQPSTNSNPTKPPPAVSTPITKPSTIAFRSPLTVASWIDASETDSTAYFTRLLFQNDDGYLSATTFDFNARKWTVTSRNFTRSRKGSSITMTKFPLSIWGGGVNNAEQLESFYVDEKSILQEWNWGPKYPEKDPPFGAEGSLSKSSISGSLSTSISTTWPYVFYQAPGNQLSVSEFVVKDTAAWVSKSLELNMLDSGGDIATVPTTQKLGNVSIIYRDANSNLVEVVRNTSAEAQLTSRADPPLVSSFPETAHFTTMALAPLSGSSNALQTYLLYQSPTNSTVYVRYRASVDAGWSVPKTYAAFDGADRGTHIACTTGFTWPDRSIETGERVGKCYFQVGGMVREVEIVRGKGDVEVDWSVKGWVDVI
ncbi:hypothetical protein B0J11DRAFT_617841 [Dendryphion nanum]|uniref:Fucose-specific lectin n=1 Tax=Dendryphion nanum TaxID=256645 RepID=A0A9P9ICQ0_9PLEO|nr:hypothetical protein B0J11DRAFT_617841 [Dendryphion nanum]